MKPLGTITKYFPFVDVDSREILLTVMHEASNFADFVSRLCEKVCKEQVPSVVSYLAVRFAFYLGETRLVRCLTELKSDSPHVQALVMLADFISGKALDFQWDTCQDILKKALANIDDDWLVCDIFLTFIEIMDSCFPESDLMVEAKESVEEFLKDKKELEFYVPLMKRHIAAQLKREGKSEEAVRVLKEALRLAETHNDDLEAIHILQKLVGLTKWTDTKKAKGFLTKLKEIAEPLGLAFVSGIINKQLGHISAVRGEYDLAVEYHMKSLQINMSLGMPIYRNPQIISMNHNMAGNVEKALEWAKIAVEGEYAPPRSLTFAHGSLAWALTGLGRHSEAWKELEKARDSAIRSGMEVTVGFCHMVEAVLERTEGDPQGSGYTLERALEIFERYGHPWWINQALLLRAEVEIEMFSSDDDNLSDEFSGNWLENLVRRVQDNEYPGVEAQTKLLVARLRLKQGRFDEAKMIITEIEKIAESSGMKYLNRKIVPIAETISKSI